MKVKIGEYERKRRSTGGGGAPKVPDSLFLAIRDVIPQQFSSVEGVADDDNTQQIGDATLDLPHEVQVANVDVSDDLGTPNLVATASSRK